MPNLSRRQFLSAAQALGLTVPAALAKSSHPTTPTPGTTGQATPGRRAGLSPVPQDPAWLPENPAIVFYSPHQDDETISMGVGIREALTAGRDVHLMLVTDGALTGATRDVDHRLRQTSPSQHLPVLGTRQTALARTREFLAAAAALGVPAANVHLESVPGTPPTPQHPYVDTDETDLGKFSQVIATYTAQFPTAAHATMSWLDCHPDHYHLGQALDTWARTRHRDDVRFFQSPLYQQHETHAPRLKLTSPHPPHQDTPTPPQRNATSPGPDHEQLQATHPLATRLTVPPVPTPRGWLLAGGPAAPYIHRAVAQYRLWDPTHDRYGLGWASVHSQLDYVDHAPHAWVHLSSAHWNPHDLATANQWITTYRNLT